jgi:peptidoglycan/LPS O-acetylase OafA/YrhL
MWTMPLEVRGSFLVYGLSFVSVRMQRPRIMFGIYAFLTFLLLSPAELSGALFSCPFAEKDAVCTVAEPLPGPTFRFYAAFVVGLVLAELRTIGVFDDDADPVKKEQRGSRWIRPRWLLFVFAAWVSGFYRMYDCDSSDALSAVVGQDAEVLLVIGASALVLFCCLEPVAQAFLMKKPCQWLGEVSFGLYLLHSTVFFSVGSAVMTATSTESYAGAAVLSLLASILVLLPLSQAFYVYVDTGLAGGQFTRTLPHVN